MKEDHSAEGRVLRRQTFSSNVLFLDLMVTSLDGEPTAGPSLLSCCVSSAPEVVSPGQLCAIFYADKHVFALARDSVRPGDVIRARGAFEAEQQAGKVPCARWTKGLRVSHVEVLEKWEPAMGAFHLRSSAKRGSSGVPGLRSVPDEPVTAERVRRQGGLPGLVLQCPDAYVQRVVSYLRLKHGTGFAGEVCHPSMTELSNTAERHILVSAQCAAAAHQSLQASILADPNLSGALTACLRFQSDENPAGAQVAPAAQAAQGQGQARAFATTGELVTWLKCPDRHRRLGAGETSSLRLQAFPPFLKRRILTLLESHECAGFAELTSDHSEGRGGGCRPLFRLDPTAGADWVLSVVLAHGCLLASAS